MSDIKKYYWLKLHKDFFKRHDIRIVESMPNGDKYILFYLKLLTESIDHEGKLRFSDTIPYNIEMLATITNTDIDTVRSAIDVFDRINLIEVMDDGTYFMGQCNRMIGSNTEWAEKKRLYREKKKEEGQKEDMSDKSKRESKSKDIEIDKEKEEYKRAESLYLLHKKNIDQGYKVSDKQLDSWSKDIEKLHRLDDRSWEDIDAVITMVKSPGNFWNSNIMSGKKLREKFPTLFAQLKPQKSMNQGRRNFDSFTNTEEVGG